jgi:hypothetical protein
LTQRASSERLSRLIEGGTLTNDGGGDEPRGAAAKLLKLPLHDLSDRHPGLTKALGDGYCEAASVCLSRHHLPPVMVELHQASASDTYLAIWALPDERTQRAWANETDATRDAAYGASLAAVELALGMVAVRRAENLTGADYYIAPLGTDPDDFESCWRLEVSGIDRGDEAAIRRRLDSKLRQAKAGRSNLPAFASVVAFSQPAIAIAEVEET